MTSGSLSRASWTACAPFEAAATEIGGDGIFLKTTQLLPEGSMITVRLALPGVERAFTVLARVVRVVRGGLSGLRPAGMGIQFIDLGAGERKLVLDYIHARLPVAA